MTTLRKEIIKRIKEIKKTEKGFNTRYWKNDFFSWGDDNGFSNIKCKHITDVKFEELPPADLMRFFEWVIRNQVDVTERRVNDLLIGE